MTLTLNLSRDFEKQLEAEASQQGFSAAQYAQRVLEAHLQRQRTHAEAIAQIEAWIVDGDEVEQKETGDLLVETLDEARHATRLLFPPDLKGKTW